MTLTRPQVATLGWLERVGHSSTSTIAAHLGRSTGVVTSTLLALERRGFVERTTLLARHPADRPGTRWAITAAGRLVVTR